MRVMNDLGTTLYVTDDTAGMTLEERAKLVLQTLGRTPQEIKAAYRKLARQHHPDKPGGDTATFQVINEAHTLLTGGSMPKNPLLANDALILKITGRRMQPLIDRQREREEYERWRRDHFYGVGVI